MNAKMEREQLATARQAEIPEIIGLLQESVKALKDELQGLEKAVFPVLGETIPNPVDNGENEPNRTNSPLGIQLYCLLEEVRSIRRYVDDIIGRVRL